MSEFNPGIVQIFSARACAAPLERAAKLFEEQTGIQSEISIRNRHCASPVAEEATGETGVQFMGFLASPQAQVFYEKYGWWVPKA